MEARAQDSLAAVVNQALNDYNGEISLTSLGEVLRQNWPTWRASFPGKRRLRDIIEKELIANFFGFALISQGDEFFVAREELPEEHFVAKLEYLMGNKDSIPLGQVQSHLDTTWPYFCEDLMVSDLNEAVKKYASDTYRCDIRKGQSYISRHGKQQNQGNTIFEKAQEKEHKPQKKVADQPVWGDPAAVEVYDNNYAQRVQEEEEEDEEAGEEEPRPRSYNRKPEPAQSQLTLENLKKHDMQFRELRQFGCARCNNRTWWKKVPGHKPVSRCKSCSIRYDAIPPERAHGYGTFDCSCGHRWTNRNSKGNLQQQCRKCRAMVTATSIQPPIRSPGIRQSNARHSCAGCSTGACKFQFEASAAHRSSGSTISTSASVMSNGSFDDFTNEHDRFEIFRNIFERGEH